MKKINLILQLTLSLQAQFQKVSTLFFIKKHNMIFFLISVLKEKEKENNGLHKFLSPSVCLACFIPLPLFFSISLGFLKEKTMGDK